MSAWQEMPERVKRPVVRLDPDQVERYRQDGYLHLSGFLPAEPLREWICELESWPETPGKWMLYYEHHRQDPDRRLLCRAENFLPYHAGLRELCEGVLRLTAEQLMGEGLTLFKDKLNFKLPGGDGFAPHQDVQAGWDAWGSIHLTAMVAIDHATRSNGCLEVVPGRHREGLLGPMHEPLGELGLRFQPLEAAPGDTIFFDSFVPHRSGPNDSSQPRRILYITYGLSREGDRRQEYFVAKRKSYPPDCEREAGQTYRYRV